MFSCRASQSSSGRRDGLGDKRSWLDIKRARMKRPYCWRRVVPAKDDRHQPEYDMFQTYKSS